MEADCPTWGCKGVLLVEGRPRHNQLVWCERWPGTRDPTCGRCMRWDAHRQSWFPVGQLRPNPDGSFHPDHDHPGWWASN
jgi:hypothetical protein